MIVQTINKLSILIFFVSLYLIGCGGGGSGTNQEDPRTKSVNLEKLLASDGPISNAKIKFHTELQSDRVPADNLPSILTDAHGFAQDLDNLKVDPSTTHLFFEVSEGTSEGGSMGEAYFIGAVELDTSKTKAEAIKRVNISPFTTLIAHAKAQNPTVSLSKIAQDAVLPFFATTNVGEIDINSDKYNGTTTSSIEADGDAALFQIMNEMIKIAAEKIDSTGSLPEKISKFIAENIEKDVKVDSQKPLFASSTVGIFKELSTISAILSTDAENYHDGFFSKALSIISTSDASFKPTTFETGVVRDTHFKIKNKFMIDGTEAKITQVKKSGEHYRAEIYKSSESSTSEALVLTSVPNMITLTRIDNSYRPTLDTDLYVLWKENNGDYIEIIITSGQVIVDKDNIFKLKFAKDKAKISAEKSTEESITNHSITKTKEFVSSKAGQLELNIDALITWVQGEIPDKNIDKNSIKDRFQDSTDITIRFEKNVFFEADGITTKFNEIYMKGITISSE